MGTWVLSDHDSSAAPHFARPAASGDGAECRRGWSRIDGRPHPRERCVVTSWQTGSEGRRLIAEAALFGEEENLLAVGRAVWVVVDRQVQLGKT